MNAQANLPVTEEFGGFRAPFKDKPELWVFIPLILVLNVAMLMGSPSRALDFFPGAVLAGEWWRLLTHPFVHATWYHLLLDGMAFVSLYAGLLEKSVVRRLLFVAAGVAGSVVTACLAAPNVATIGLCGLSSIAHGLMAISALEMMAGQPLRSVEWRIGASCFLFVVSKAAIEAITGKMFFTFLHFGMMGQPVAVSHAGGILGALGLFLGMRVATLMRGKKTSRVGS